VFLAPVNGRYTQQSIARRGEVLRPGGFPDVTIPIDAVLRT
jgi:hypothetical protein